MSNDPIVVIKNFQRNRMVNLTALSVRHFLPNAPIYCYTLYKQSMDEYANQEPLHPFITEFTAQTKYVNKLITIQDHVDPTKTSGYGNPDNGVYFVEGFNLIFEKFSHLTSPLIILAEDHFFTTGETLADLLSSEWDVAYADGGTEDHSRPNASILGLIPTKVAHLFPMAETRGVDVEWLLSGHLLNHIEPSRLYRMKHRKWHGSVPDYCGDGVYTNSSDVMYDEMRKVGIL